ncbi:hypothetical protein AX14_013821 [Amanita brunnescens Koide BX004]|nr:hypothetical protein AX14_013821 [Amanita brunnescens Koide BX004]
MSAAEITRSWLVTDKDGAFMEALRALWTKHSILPLPIYDGTRYIEPPDVPSILQGSLVEVHFCLKHYFISKNIGNFDAFTGLIEQIIILKKCSSAHEESLQEKYP